MSEDRKSLEPLFQTTLDYYGKLLRTPNGMYLNSWRLNQSKRPNNFCSIASVGVGLMALCMEHELGRNPNAAEQALQTLRTFNGKVKDYKLDRDSSGFFRHFYNANTGKGKSEFSTIDTSILVVGALYCRNTFKDPRIISEADELWKSIDWQKALAKPNGTRLYMVMKDGKPKPHSITAMFNEYYILNWLIREDQLKKTGKSNLKTFREFTTWNNNGLTLLSDPRKVPHCSFIVQFPLYMCQPGAADADFLKFVQAQAKADQRASSQRTKAPHLWGCGAGLTPRQGYKASDYNMNQDNVVSPNIIAGFIPAHPEAQRHLAKLYKNPKLLVKTPHGNILPRFSVDMPNWKPHHIEGIDYSSMLFGLAASHPKLGMEFFKEKTKFTFK